MKKIQILFISYLAVTILASAFLGRALWSLSSWSSVSYTMQIVLAALSLLLLASPINRKVQEAAGHRFFREKWILLLLFAALIAAMWRFSPGHDYWGERHQISDAIEKGTRIIPGSSLAMLINLWVFKAVNSILLINSSESTALLSIILGGIYVLAAAHLSRILHRDGSDILSRRSLSILFVISGGYFTLFYGQGGVLPVTMTIVILFISSSVMHLRGKAPLWLAGLLLILTVLCYAQAFFLLPGFLYLLMIHIRQKRSGPDLAAAIIIVAGAWAAADLLSGSLGGVPGPTGSILSLFSEFPVFLAHGPMNIVSGWGNGLLIIGPASVTAVFFLIHSINARRRAENIRNEEIFLATLSVSALLILLLLAGKIDSGIRWGIFGISGPVFAAYSLWALAGRHSTGGRFGYAAVLIISLGLFHSVPMIASSFSKKIGEERLMQLPLDEGRAERIIGTRYYENREYAEATDWLDRSIKKNDKDDSVWFLRGTISTLEGRTDDALSDLLHATRLKPGDPEYSESLAEAYIEKSWMEEAVNEYRKLIEYDPTEVRFWERLGYAQNHNGMYEEAIKTYETVLEFDPENDRYVKNLTSAVINRGSQLHEEKRYEEAKSYYLRARRLYPTDWIALNNLALIAIETGDYEEAYSILSEALETNTLSWNLYYNMSLVEEELGDLEAAYDHLLRSAELNRNAPPPNDDIRRLLRKMGKLEENRE